MASEKDPLISMLASSSGMDSPGGSTSLLIHNPLNDVKEAPLAQKWELVIAYPSASTDEFLTKEQEAIENKRRDIERDLINVGLNVSPRESSDKKTVFLLVGASQDKLEEHAEEIGLCLALKPEFGGGYSAYTKAKKNIFQGTSDGLLSKTERQRLLVNIIECDKDDGGAEINLRGLEFDGIVQKVYPLHENSAKKRLIDHFVKKPLAPIPIDEIRKYFGEEIAFYFAWLSFYTKWLAMASVVGFVTSIIGWANVKGEYNWSNAVYSVFIGVWATLFLEFWKRERNICAWKWNMLDYEEVEGLRPGFTGDEKMGAYAKGQFVPLKKGEGYGGPDPKERKSFPEERTHLRMAVGISLIITLCAVVIIATISVLTFRILVQNNHKYASYASVVGGVANAIVIMIMNKVYRFVALKLNDWENHRTNTYYTDNLVFKIFLFQFVNSYTSMYYIAFFKRNTILWGDSSLKDTCGDDSEVDSFVFGWGCPNQLYVQLLTILGTNIAVGQAQEVLIPWLVAKAKLLWLERNAKREESDIPKYEREFELNQFEGLVDEYGEMVIQYGYLTLFASSVPIAPLLAVLNNAVEMRTDTWKLLTSYNKPFYRGADDIGAWYAILQVLGVVAVITNSLLLLFTFPPLYRAFSNDKFLVLWTVVILEHVIFLTKFIVSVTVADVPSSIRSILAKQHYIQQQLRKKFERKHIGLQRERSAHLRHEIEAVENYE